MLQRTSSVNQLAFGASTRSAFPKIVRLFLLKPRKIRWPNPPFNFRIARQRASTVQGASTKTLSNFLPNGNLAVASTTTRSHGAATVRSRSELTSHATAMPSTVSMACAILLPGAAHKSKKRCPALQIRDGAQSIANRYRESAASPDPGPHAP